LSSRSCRDGRAAGVTRGLLVVGLGRVAAFLIGVALLAWLARHLEPERFGVLQFGIALMAYPALLVDLGLTTHGVRELAERSAAGGVIERVLSARVALAAATSLAVLLVVAVAPVSADRRITFAVLALGLPAAALGMRWVLQGETRFGRMALVDVLAVLAQLLVAVAVVSDPSDVAWAAAAITTGAWVGAGASVFLSNPIGRYRIRFNAAARKAVQASIQLGLAAIAITVYYSIDTVLLGIFRSSAEVGYYAAAYRLILPVLGVAGTVGAVALPRLVAEIKAAPGRAEQTTRQLAHYMILVAAPATIGGSLLANPIIESVYDATYAPAAAPFAILVISVLTVYGNSAFAFLLLARRGDGRYLRATVAGAILNLAVNLVAIPMAGVIGAALTTIASEILVLGLILHATRDVALSAFAGALRAIALPLAAMTAAAWYLQESLVAIPVAAGLYGLALVATGSLWPPSPGAQMRPAVRR
jgi:O-antigen/teichoic acid export membrane protein